MEQSHFIQGATALNAALQKAAEEKALVVIDWYAPWCGPCNRIAPFYNSLREEFPEVNFLTVNSEEPINKADQLLASYGIRSFPTFTFHVDTKEVERLVGANPDRLKQTVQRLEESMEDKRLEEALYLSQVGNENSGEEPKETSEVEKLNLNVKRVSGEVLKISIPKDATIIALKESICKETGTSPELQKIIFKGKLLKDNQLLEAVGITENNLTVHVIAKAPQQSGSSGHAWSSTASNGTAEGIEKFRQTLSTFVLANGRDKAQAALNVVKIYVKNLIKHPDDPKYQAIRMQNAKYLSAVAVSSCAENLMQGLGFSEETRNGEKYWVHGGGELVPLQQEIESKLEYLASNSQNNSNTMPASNLNPFASFAQRGGYQLSPEMAQSMMQNPVVENLMQNMNISGGLPNLTELMNNPEMQTMMRNVMNDPNFLQMMRNPEILQNLGSFAAANGGYANQFNFDPSQFASMFGNMLNSTQSNGTSNNQENSRNATSEGNGNNDNSEENEEDEDDLDDLDNIYHS